MAVRESLLTEIDTNLLSELRCLAQLEGTQVQALLDEALADLIEKRRMGRPRQLIMDTYRSSHERYTELYQKLAQ